MLLPIYNLIVFAAQTNGLGESIDECSKYFTFLAFSELLLRAFYTSSRTVWHLAHDRQPMASIFYISLRWNAFSEMTSEPFTIVHTSLILFWPLALTNNTLCYVYKTKQSKHANESPGWACTSCPPSGRWFRPGPWRPWSVSSRPSRKSFWSCEFGLEKQEGPSWRGS